MKFELPPPIPAKRASPRKVEPPPRDEVSSSVKPLPAVPPPPPPQASPPPIPPAPSTPAPSSENAGKPAKAGESLLLVVGFTALGLGLLIAWAISDSPTQTVPSNSGSYSAPTIKTPGGGSSTGDSVQPSTKASPSKGDIFDELLPSESVSQSSPAPSASVDEWELKRQELEKRAADSFATASPMPGYQWIEPSPSPPQTYRVVNVDRRDNLKMRSGPAQTYPVVATLPPGSGGILLLAGRIANGSTMWQQISAGSLTGWVNEIYLEPVFPRAVEVR